MDIEENNYDEYLMSMYEVGDESVLNDQSPDYIYHKIKINITIKYLNKMTTQELIQQLTDNTRKGDLNIDQINDLTYALRQALRQSQRANRSPESYAAAAEKGKATRAQNAVDMDTTMARSRDMDAQDKMVKQDRIDKGLLPLTADDYSGKPDPKYYEFTGNDQRSGIGYYKLKDEYKDTVVGMDESLIKRWAELANVK